MLKRLAGNCFWMGRYLERAENIARTLGVVERLAHAPEHHRDPGPLWTETLMMCSDENQFRELGHHPDAGSVLEWCFLDRSNQSSVLNCLGTARDNARTARHLLTNDSWEALNGAWIEMQGWHDRVAVEAHGGWEDACAWATRQCLLVRGAFLELPRDQLPQVITMGQMTERLAYTATVLQMSPITRAGDAACWPGSPLQRRTEAALAAAGGIDTFGRGDRGGVCPREVVNFLLGDPVSPRSLLVCSRAIVECIVGLTGGESARHARSLPAARELVDRVCAAYEGRVEIVAAMAGIVTSIFGLSGIIARDHFETASAA